MHVIMSCDAASVEASKTQAICKELKQFENDEIKKFITFVEDHKIVFTAADLFEINRRTILSALSIMTNYLIIILQFNGIQLHWIYDFKDKTGLKCGVIICFCVNPSWCLCVRYVKCYVINSTVFWNSLNTSYSMMKFYVASQIYKWIKYITECLIKTHNYYMFLKFRNASSSFLQMRDIRINI